MQGYDSLTKRLENDDLTGVNGNEDNPSTEITDQRLRSNSVHPERLRAGADRAPC